MQKVTVSFDSDGRHSLFKISLSLRVCTADGDTPLHSAAFKGYGDTCRVLLAHGADVNAKDAGTWHLEDNAISLSNWLTGSGQPGEHHYTMLLMSTLVTSKSARFWKAVVPM